MGGWDGLFYIEIEVEYGEIFDVWFDFFVKIVFDGEIYVVVVECLC